MMQEGFEDTVEVVDQDATYTEDCVSEQASDQVADLVEYLVCGLVDDCESVALDVTDTQSQTLIEISCAPQDAGKIIGRKGRIIKAIRTLARALGQRVGTSVEVEVLG